MLRQIRLKVLTAGFLVSSLVLSHQAQAREWLLAQAKPQDQAPPKSQPSPSSSPSSAPAGFSSSQPTTPLQFSYPASGSAPSGGSPSKPSLSRPSSSGQSSGGWRRNPFFRYSNPDTSFSDRTSLLERRQRRIPIEPVPMPDARRIPLEPEPQKRIPRIPNSFASPSTGIMAQVMVTPICSIASSTGDCGARPYLGQLKVMSISRDRLFRVATNLQGQVQLRLAPGVYVIQPDSPDFLMTTSQTVTVIDGMMRSMQLNFQSNTKPQPVAGGIPRQTPEQVPGQALAPQPLRPPTTTWQPSLVSQPLYPPIGQ